MWWSKRGKLPFIWRGRWVSGDRENQHCSFMQCHVIIWFENPLCMSSFHLLYHLNPIIPEKRSKPYSYSQVNIKIERLNCERCQIVYKPFWEFDPMRSDVLGVEVTWSRPMATRQQWEAPWASSSPRSIYGRGRERKASLGSHYNHCHNTAKESRAEQDYQC